MKKTIIILFIIKYSLLFSQVHKIYIDTPTEEKVVVSERYAQTFLNNELPDGVWMVYFAYQKDSTKKYIDNLIRFIGHYKNFKRNGMFIYYYGNYGHGYSSYIRKEKKIKPVEELRCNFKNGKLHGFYARRHPKGFLMHTGYYVNGKKNGLFVNYYIFDGMVKEIKLYKNDTLFEWTKFYNNGIIRSKGCGEYELLNDSVFEFDTLGNLEATRFYKTGSQLWYKKYYSNGTIKKIGKGKFDCSWISGLAPPPSCIDIPVDGEILFYDEKGHFLKKEIYKKGKLIN